MEAVAAVDGEDRPILSSTNILNAITAEAALVALFSLSGKNVKNPRKN